MAVRLFEGQDHAASYQKYRPGIPEELQEIVLAYVQKKNKGPFTLAVDVGCGTGMCTRAMAPYFQKVVGVDVSEAQILEAQKVPGFPNVSYSTGTAEELPFEDNSVDLITGADAAHWFDMKKFMMEAERVLKPKGCLALLSIQVGMELHYGDCSEALTQIFREMYALLSPYKAKNVNIVENGYTDIIDAITFTDKERVTDILVKSTTSVSEVIGYVSTFSMYQLFLKKDPTAARSMLQNTEQRILQAMKVSSNKTELEMQRYYVCVLACKPE